MSGYTLCRKNLRKVVVIVIILVIAISGATVYALNKKNVDEISLNADMNSEEGNIIDEEPAPAKEEESIKVEEVISQQPEEKSNTVKEDTPKVNSNNKQVQEVNEKPKEIPNKENKVAVNKSITYTSKGLGISFDIPGNWKDKYLINDNGKKISVYMKHNTNSQGGALLFIITSDLTAYNNGDFIDTIGGLNKEITISDKKYLIGGPTDCSVGANDPDIKLYKEMLSQRKDVLLTLK